ncbi:MAG: protein-export chaperone SecB [Rhodospirillales bacterium]|nr:protein-export chaperone SecB [Rhodospirillales bacterium]
MADEITPPTPGAEDQPQGVPLTINAQYVKDLSFEVPNAPAIFGQMQSTSPDINIDIQVNAKSLGENHFEVSVTINANCDVADTKGFILELVYAGAFTLNLPDEHRQAVLMVECPRLLFPFARNIVADVTRDGGFPPVMLGLVDFASMYQRRVAEQQAANNTAANADAE